MKLRVKHQGPPSCQWRLALEGGAPTLGQLQQALVESLGLPTDQPVSVSLNKREPLGGTADTPLHELGICNGDLLWLLSPAPPAALAASAAPAAVNGSREAAAAAPAAAAEPAAAKRARGGNEASTSQPQQQQQQGAVDKGKRAVGADDGMQAEELEQEPVPLEPLPPSQRVPAYLLRTLRASLAPVAPAAQRSPAGLLLLAAHAAMLESGFSPCWATAAPASSGAAADAAGQQQEGELADVDADAAEGALNDASSAYQVPASAWASAGICRIEYHLVPPTTSGNNGGASSKGDAASGMEVEVAEPAADAKLPLVQQQEGEQALEQAGEEAGEEAGPGCTLHFSSLGGGRLVLAVSTQRHTRHLALSAATFVHPLASSPEPAEEEEAGPSGSSSAAAAVSGDADAVADAASAVHFLPGGGLAVAGLGVQLEAPGVRDLWRQLKDGLAFPMLLAAYAEAGLQPPAGLLALPEELKARVLGMLGAVDLAALCCACSELRHLASQDDLWRPLLSQHFPHASSYITTQAQRRGYKWAYGQCMRERRQREDELRRARARAFHPAVPRFGMPRPPPFYPPHPGRGGLRIIGGDYDRFPQLGPFGTGGINLNSIPPGGQFGGGSLFGGGTPRRQGRGGSGGFRLS